MFLFLSMLWFSKSISSASSSAMIIALYGEECKHDYCGYMLIVCLSNLVYSS